MTDTTAERRALLAVLLDRVDRGHLLDAERPLLRALVAADQAAADAQLTDGDDTSDAPRRAADALYEATAMLQAIGEGTWSEAIEVVEARAMAYDRSGGRALALAGRTVSSEAAWQAALDRAQAETARRERQYTAEYTRAERAEATIARVRTAGHLCSDCRINIRAVLDDEQPADQPKALPAAVDLEFVPTYSIPDDWATGTEPQCPARYIGPPPSLAEPACRTVDYRCERRPHDRRSDHARRQDDPGVWFAWTDAIAVYPTDTPEV